MMRSFTTLLLALLLLAGCQDPPPELPKPRIYPKVIYPDKGFEVFDVAQCPFEMPLPSYFEIQKDTLQNEDEQTFDCWYHLHCRELNSYLHMSYVPFSNRKEFDELVDDAFDMANKHNIKASQRQESLVSNPDSRVHGLIFEIDGPVATPFQFYLTDSTRHFLRASLYFKANVNRDSIEPVYDFVKEDVVQM